MNLVFIVRLMFYQTLLFSLAITVAAFPMRAFISTLSDRFLEIVDLKYLKLSATERLEPLMRLKEGFLNPEP